MTYLRIDEDGDVTVQREEPKEEDLRQIEDGTLQMYKAENIRGEIMFRRAVVTLNAGEGDDEEDELELYWELLV